MPVHSGDILLVILCIPTSSHRFPHAQTGFDMLTIQLRPTNFVSVRETATKAFNNPSERDEVARHAAVRTWAHVSKGKRELQNFELHQAGRVEPEKGKIRPAGLWRQERRCTSRLSRPKSSLMRKHARDETERQALHASGTTPATSHASSRANTVRR